MKIPTYPARPVNGGTWKPGKREGWSYEPKYNGWRALVHVPTGTMFNRHGELLTIAQEFSQALAELQFRFTGIQWLDCEALERRHNIGKGTLIVLDLVPHWQGTVVWINGLQLPVGGSPMTFSERRATLTIDCLPLEVGDLPKEGAVYTVPHKLSNCPAKLWDELQEVNHAWGCQFYEGIVAKRDDSPYNIQLVSPDQTTSDWIKYRHEW